MSLNYTPFISLLEVSAIVPTVPCSVCFSPERVNFAKIAIGFDSHMTMLIALKGQAAKV